MGRNSLHVVTTALTSERLGQSCRVQTTSLLVAPSCLIGAEGFRILQKSSKCTIRKAQGDRCSDGGAYEQQEYEV